MTISCLRSPLLDAKLMTLELEEEPEIIRKICQVALDFGPQYDCDQVYRAWTNMNY